MVVPSEPDGRELVVVLFHAWLRHVLGSSGHFGWSQVDGEMTGTVSLTSTVKQC